MNYEPLGDLHGAPLRLRVENQLGFKMVKWIRAIEFVHSPETVSQGEGGGKYMLFKSCSTGGKIYGH